MAVSQINEWRRPGCGPDCWPRQHDPDAHEAYGYRLATERQVYTIGPLRIDLAACTATVDGHLIPLVGREWQILVYLTQHLDRWCGSEEIERAIWGCVNEEKPGNVVRVNIFKLRHRLGQAGTLIWSRQGFGYLLQSDPSKPLPVPDDTLSAGRLNGRWATKYDDCQRCCNTTYPHHAHGLCTSCTAKMRRERIAPPAEAS